MTHEFVIVPAGLVALLFTAMTSAMLVSADFYFSIWDRSLVDLAIFCAIWGAIVVFVPGS